jgi:flavin-binding protein dodecin
MESTYKVIELIGTSVLSWEEAAKNAIDTACKSLKDIRIAEAVDFDMKVEEGKVVVDRTRVNISYKYRISVSHRPYSTHRIFSRIQGLSSETFPRAVRYYGYAQGR